MQNIKKCPDSIAPIAMPASGIR